MATEHVNRINLVKPSATMALNDKANSLRRSGVDVINLTAGEPDFDTPEPIKAAAIQAINNGFTKYSPIDGYAELKSAIIKKLCNDNELEYDMKQVIVSNGAKQVLYAAVQAILNPGDEVIIPAPYWVSYPAFVKLAGGTPVFVKSDMESHFKITAKQLAAAITPQTKLLILNSPSNPSGKAYTPCELQALGKVLLDHPHIMVMTDDIYEYLLWPPHQFANIVNAVPELKSRTIVVNGVSKAYAMTGWRIGYGAGPNEIISAMKKLQSHSTSGPCSISQQAAIAAITAGKTYLAPMLEAYQQRHEMMVEGLSKMKYVDVIPSDGTFYLFIGVNKAIAAHNLESDTELADLLLEKANVATVPGSSFGTPGFLRISFATSTEILQKALERFAKILDT